MYAKSRIGSNREYADRCGIRDFTIYVRIENISPNAIYISAFDFSVIDFNLRVHNIDNHTFEDFLYLESTTLLPGTHTSGELNFGWFFITPPRKIVYQSILANPLIIDLAKDMLTLK